MGIIHHSNYVKWMEEARMDLMDQMGLSYKQMEEMEIISPVLSIAVEYHSMVHFDDTVVIPGFGGGPIRHPVFVCRAGIPCAFAWAVSGAKCADGAVCSTGAANNAGTVAGSDIAGAFYRALGGTV